MKIKYCLKIVTTDSLNHSVVRRYFYKDINELNIMFSQIMPCINYFQISSMEIVKL